jgi:hypothetical protein
MKNLKKSVLEPEHDEDRCKECSKIISKEETEQNEGFCRECLTNYFNEFKGD